MVGLKMATSFSPLSFGGCPGLGSRSPDDYLFKKIIIKHDLHLNSLFDWSL